MPLIYLRFCTQKLSKDLVALFCCVCESLVRFERSLPSHMLKIIKKEISLRA